MNRSTLFITIITTTLLLTQCTVEPAPINYGTDSCHFCKMTIVDQQHAAQIVTKKGRSYKFDAIECMVNSIPQWEKEAIHSYLITDYSSPKKLVDATTAHYLIAEHIPSPMGEFLSGFESEQSRNESSESAQDQNVNWSDLPQVITQN